MFKETLDEIMPKYKAKASLQLIQATTGEVIQEVEAHNALTPAGKDYLLWSFKEPLRRFMAGTSLTATDDPFYPFESLILSSEDMDATSSKPPSKSSILGIGPKHTARLNDPIVGAMDPVTTVTSGNKIIYGFTFNTGQAVGTIKTLGWGTWFPKRYSGNLFEKLTDSSNITSGKYYPYFADVNKNYGTKPLNATNDIACMIPHVVDGKNMYIGYEYYGEYIYLLDEDLNFVKSDYWDNTSSSIIQGIVKYHEYVYLWDANTNRLFKVAIGPDGLPDASTQTYRSFARNNTSYGYNVMFQKDEESVYFLWHDSASVHKLLRFDLATFDTKETLSAATADEVIDVSHLYQGMYLTTASYFAPYIWNPKSGTWFAFFRSSTLSENVMLEITEDFSTIVETYVMPSGMGRVAGYNQKTDTFFRYPAATGLANLCDLTGMGTKVTLPTPITKQEDQILKVTYTFEVTP